MGYWTNRKGFLPQGAPAESLRIRRPRRMRVREAHVRQWLEP